MEKLKTNMAELEEVQFVLLIGEEFKGMKN
jgi:hypothetical protein